jgi:hypothetical protein
MSVFSRVDVFSMSRKETDFRQLVFTGADKTDFEISDLKSDNRYRLAIAAIDRKTLAASRSFGLEVQTNKTEKKFKVKPMNICLKI